MRCDAWKTDIRFPGSYELVLELIVGFEMNSFQVIRKKNKELVRVYKKFLLFIPTNNSRFQKPVLTLYKEQKSGTILQKNTRD